MKKLLLFALTFVAALASAKPLPEPLTLDDALGYALDHNPSLQAVRAALKEKEGVLIQTTAQALPKVTLEAEGSMVDRALQESDAARAAGTKTWSAAIVARHTLFSGGGTVGDVRADLARLQAAKARAKEAVEATILEVKQKFYAVIVDRQIISVRTEALEVLEEQLKDVKAKYTAGVASDFERLQAQVALSNAKPDLIRAQNDYRVAVDALLATLGAPEGTQLMAESVQGELDSGELPEVDVDELLILASKNRPQLRVANRDYAAAQSEVWASRGKYLPRVDLFGSYGLQKSALSSDLDDKINGWSAGVSVTLPVFDSFSNAAGVYSAKARRRQAAAADLQTRLSVALEVRQSYGDYMEAREILKSAENVVAEARESLRLSKARYEVGSSTQLDVLQAQSALSQARLNLLSSRYDALIAQARLQKATGSSDFLPPHE